MEELLRLYVVDGVHTEWKDPLDTAPLHPRLAQWGALAGLWLRVQGALKCRVRVLGRGSPQQGPSGFCSKQGQAGGTASAGWILSPSLVQARLLSPFRWRL